MLREWNYPGARWWKFDFHSHTPASKDTEAWQKAIGTFNEVTPERWLLKYMAAEIDCVAITDHNSGAWIDRLKAAYEEMKTLADAGTPPDGFRELYLFPGLEISVNGGIHLLAIFDPIDTGATITSLLGGVGFPAHLHGETDATDEAACTRETLVKVVEEIHRCGGLAIPAHSDKGKGLLETTGATNQGAKHTDAIKSLKKSELLAIETVNCQADKPTIYRENWVQVLGSDCHSFKDLGIPGRRFTWVKMETPSKEGLRLALLDGQGMSIKRSDVDSDFDPLKKPEHFIESMEIRDARYMGGNGEHTQLQFSPYFNALIGGRGTGKSTIVHALRLAFRRKDELSSGTEAWKTFENFVAPSKGQKGGLREETQITVQLSRDEIAYRLHWKQKQEGDAVTEKNSFLGEDFVSSQIQFITPERFPISLFSQGQIAALASDGQGALLQIIDKAAATSQQQEKFEEAKRAFLATQAQVRELHGKLKARDANNLALQDVQRKLARFENSDHATILKNYQRSSRQKKELEHQFEGAAELVTQLHALATNLLADDLPDDLFDPNADGGALALIQELHAAIHQARKAVEESAKQLAQQKQMLQGGLDESDWKLQHAQAQAAYDTLKADLQQQGVNDPSEYGRLVQEKQRLDVESKRLDALQAQKEKLENTAQQQQKAVEAARRAITSCRQTFLDTALSDNPYVRMSLIPYSRDAEAINQSLRGLLGLIDDAKYRDQIYQEAQGDSPARGLVIELLSAIKFEEALDKLKTKLREACYGKGEFGGWFNKFLEKEFQNRPEFIDHLHCWFPEDSLQVSYSRKGDGQDFRPIAQASAGQRAAAMLAFLLAHGTEPLVLDQPEDDLDNHLIYDLVVQQIRANKLKRQLIIVTHNPNIVVNGDAEYIHILDFNNQCYVKQSASLQDKALRKKVCQVMEGGKDAFDRRYQRLGKDV